MTHSKCRQELGVANHLTKDRVRELAAGLGNSPAMWVKAMRAGRWLHRSGLLGSWATPLWNLCQRLVPPPVEETAARLWFGTLAIPAHHIHARWYAADEYEPELTALIRRSVGPGSVFVDVGANIGYYTVMASRLGAEVIAFEPDPVNRTYLEANLAANSLTARVIGKAVVASVGQARFYCDPASINSHLSEEGEEVETTTLDAEVERADLVKVDVEGAERQVILGMRGLVEHSNNLSLVFECGQDTPVDETSRIFALLRDYGFTKGLIVDRGEAFDLARPFRPSGVCNLLVTRQESHG